MATYLGVDGGGSKTVAVIVDEGLREFGHGEAGSSNYHTIGEEKAIANIQMAVKSAADQAELSSPFDSAAFCLSGIRRPPDFERMRPRIEALGLASRVLLDHDAAGAHRGALDGKPGVVAIAGTGSFVFGIDRDGQRYTAGGWGPTLDDEGSAYWIVIESIKLILFQHDRGARETTLGNVLFEQFQVNDVMQLVDFVYHNDWSREQMASIAPTIVELAEGGDGSCSRIVNDAGKHLSRLTALVAQRIYTPNEAPVVTYHGSLFQSGSILLKSFETWIRFVRPATRVVPPTRNPAIGAAQLAMEAAK